MTLPRDAAEPRLALQYKKGKKMRDSISGRASCTPRRFDGRIWLALLCAVCFLESACSGPKIRLPGTVIAYKNAGLVAIAASGKHYALVNLPYDLRLSQVARTGFFGGLRNLYSIPGRRYVATLPCRNWQYAISPDGYVGACVDSSGHVVEFSLRPFHVRWRSTASVWGEGGSHLMKVLNNGDVIGLMYDGKCGASDDFHTPPTRAIVIGKNGRSVRALGCALNTVGTGISIIESRYDGRNVRFLDPRTGKWIRGRPEAVLKDGTVLYRDDERRTDPDLAALLKYVSLLFPDKSFTLRVTGKRGYVARGVYSADYTERDVIPLLRSSGLLNP